MIKKQQPTLASSLRNQLTSLWTLITILEQEPPDKNWEKRFRKSALETLPDIKKLLEEFPLREENK